MSVNIKVTGGLNIEWGQVDPKVTGGFREIYCERAVGHLGRIVIGQQVTAIQPTEARGAE